jgi:8-oxo-dGTP pyrophosphatase MutT (NUDIX family)
MIVPELTVAAIVEQNSRFLMVEELVYGEKVINQPAGHVEPGESFMQAVIREMLEETAWHFEPEALTGIYLWQHPDKPHPFLRVSFCGRCVNHESGRELDDGILRTLWLSKNELGGGARRLRSPMVLRCIDDYLGGIRLPCNTIQNLTTEEIAQRATII